MTDTSDFLKEREMFYEEKFIDGVWYCRTKPYGEWIVRDAPNPTPQDFIEAANALQDVAQVTKTHENVSCANLTNAELLAEAVNRIPKLSNYVIVKGRTTVDLSIAVKRRLEDGWVTLGGVSSVIETIPVEPPRGLFHINKRPEPKTKDVIVFIQAMGMLHQK